MQEDEFKSLTIEKNEYGPERGQITAKLRVSGKSVEMTIKLPPATSQALLKALAAEIARAATDQAQNFRDEFIGLVNRECESASRLPVIT